MSSTKFSSNSSQPQKDEDRRKLPLIKINYQDLLEDEPPSSKVGKGKKQKCTVTAVSNSIRKVPKPMRITYNPSDWKDISQLAQGKPANGSKKVSTKTHVVPDNTTFAKPKNLLKSDKNVRKDLFGGRRSNTLRRNSNSNNIGFKPRALVNPKIVIQLDNTQPLMDINDAEKQLYKKLDCFKTFKNQISHFNEVLNLEDTSFEVNIEAGNASSPFTTDLNVNVLKPSVLNYETDESPTESEFIKNEKIFDVNNPEPVVSESKLKSCLAKTSSNDSSDAVMKIFQDEYESFKYINDKFEILEKQFREFQLDMTTYRDKHAKNAKKLIEILESGKENFSSNKEWHVSELNGLQNCLPSASQGVRSNKKKNVVFNLNNTIENKQIPDNIELNDKGLEKAVNFYNSMRKDYKSILSTPKLDRSVLQTPKSLKKAQTDSISRRLQKQCLLLLDTPSNKNK